MWSVGAVGVAGIDTEGEETGEETGLFAKAAVRGMDLRGGRGI